MRTQVKLAIIASHAIQYQAPLWRRLHHDCGVDLEVLYASLAGSEPVYDPGFGKTVRWDVPLLDGYPWRKMRNRPLAWINWRLGYRVPDIQDVLREGRFTHVLLVGKEYAYYNEAMLAARRLGLSILYKAESHPAKGHLLLEMIARGSRRFWYRRVDAFLCAGRYQFEEYERMGVRQEQMFFSPYCVDNDHFEAQRRELCIQRNDIRRSYGFAPDVFVVGYSGKLYPRKNPMELIRAMSHLPVHAGKFGLLMVGDGAQKAACERMARSLLHMPIVFTGFLNQTELARAYTAMDLFVMPSLWETWGLVLNEAMVFGLPVIATTSVNAARDLIDQGQNGYTYASGDDAALTECIRRVFERTGRDRSMGEHSRKRIAAYSVEAACDGIMQALHIPPPSHPERREPA